MTRAERSGGWPLGHLSGDVTGALVIRDENIVVVSNRVFEAEPFGRAGPSMSAMETLFTGCALGLKAMLDVYAHAAEAS